MKRARIVVAAAAAVVLGAGMAVADGFHSPLLRNQDPRRWATTVREEIGIDAGDSAETAPPDRARARAAAVPLVDVLRYLDRQNVLLREFPDFNYDDIPGFKSEAEAILIAIGRDAAALLVKTLVADLKGETGVTDLRRAEDFLERVERILVAIGTGALDDLLTALGDPDPAVRRTLLRILRRIVPEPDFGEDIGAWSAWRRVVRAGETRSIAALPAVLSALHHPDRRMRLAALVALGDMGIRAAAVEVRPLLAESTEIVLLRQAIRTVVLLGDEDAAPALIDLLESARPEVREAAGTGLCFLVRESFGFDPRAPQDARAAAVARWRQWWKER